MMLPSRVYFMTHVTLSACTCERLISDWRVSLTVGGLRFHGYIYTAASEELQMQSQ